ncbi:hypothetical protein ACQPZA_10555 [Pseudonocardia xinjiangensis]|jgi:hypothetical protein|uniref:Uncharacterized protein n=1 Tax=Pseudonocardia xinjiangensis TaxID=75289 RepID=A0ABX1RQZ0_9PSEU|nr:hypothetical protein [Pseudonocardia xinjiangensis]NMH82284.1 hypothetical protein [Pseudonocardia xinjiangensis]
MTTTAGSCNEHAGLGAELRALVLSTLDRLEPVLERMRTEPVTQTAETCANCPVCALLAALRGDHPELAGQLAAYASGLLNVLRAALEEGAPAPHGSPAAEPDPPQRRVQHIVIDRGPVPR